MDELEVPSLPLEGHSDVCVPYYHGGPSVYLWSMLQPEAILMSIGRPHLYQGHTDLSILCCHLRLYLFKWFGQV